MPLGGQISEKVVARVFPDCLQHGLSNSLSMHFQCTFNALSMHFLHFTIFTQSSRNLDIIFTQYSSIFIIFTIVNLFRFTKHWSCCLHLHISALRWQAQRGTGNAPRESMAQHLGGANVSSSLAWSKLRQKSNSTIIQFMTIRSRVGLCPQPFCSHGKCKLQTNYI